MLVHQLSPTVESFQRLFTTPLIRHSDMPSDLRNESVSLCSRACEAFANNHQGAAQYIKEKLDKRHGGSWHVVVGEQFGLEVTHDQNTLLYLFLGSRLAVCLWKSC